MSNPIHDPRLHDPRRSLIFRSERFGIPQKSSSNDFRVKAVCAEVEAVWRDWSAVLDAADAIGADTSLPDDLRKIRIKRTAEARVRKAAERVAAVQAKASAEIARIQADFQKRREPRSGADEVRRGQVRLALLSMDPMKRGDTIRAAIAGEDKALLDSICSAYPFETGVLPAQLTDCQAALHKLENPTDAEALTLLKSGVEHLQKSTFAFVDCVANDLVPRDAEQIEQKADAASAAFATATSGSADG